jgi:F0F1-type ATP synthase membrane subunit b/b'
MCVLVQLAAGLSVSDVIQAGKDALKDSVTQAQDVIESLQEQSASSLNQLVQDADAKLDEIATTVEQGISDEYSSVSGAAGAVKACLEAQKENVSEIVDSASKYSYSIQAYS